ncbi:MAG: hypothetical protein E7147_02655 [Rikenellaceae bacterium]|nr:hypothetical protein [Rikenellaceae bacterium]
MKQNLTFEDLEGALMLISYDTADEDGVVERETLAYTYADGKLKFYTFDADGVTIDASFNPDDYDIAKVTTYDFDPDDYEDATALVKDILRSEGKEIIKEAPANEWEIVDNKVDIVVYNARRQKVAEHSWKSRAKRKKVEPKEPEMTEEEKIESFRRSLENMMYVEEQNFKSNRHMLFFHLFLMVVAGGLTAWLGYYLEWSTTKIWIFSVGMGAYFTQLWWSNSKRHPLGVVAVLERRRQYRPWINGGWIVATIVAGGLLWLSYKAGTLEENLDDLITSWFIFIPAFTLVIWVIIGSTKPLGVLMAEACFPGLHKSTRKIKRREAREFWIKFFKRLVWLD